MEVPEAKEYLAVLVDSAGRVLLRSKPGPIGGYFVRTERSGDLSPERSIIDSVFEECGLMVKVASVGSGVYFGGSGTCGYFVVELIDSDEIIKSDDFFVNWYGVEEARRLISNLKNDTSYELEMNVLGVAESIIEESVILMDGRLKKLVGTAELEDFKMLCRLIGRILPCGDGGRSGLGGSSSLVAGVLDEAKKKIELRKIGSEYLDILISKIGKMVRSKGHENCLAEVIKIYSARAYYSLVNGNFPAYKKACRLSLEHLKKYDDWYPEDGFARRERGFEGGKGKAKKTREKGRREEVVNQTIMDVLRKNAPFDKRLRPRFIVAKVLDEVLDVLRRQGFESDRKDIDGCIMNLLLSDRAAKKVIGRP